MSETPNTGIPYVPEGTLDPAAGLNDALDVIDALLQTGVIDMSHTAPPGSPIDGDLYIVAATATGDWAGEENNLACYRSEGDFWQFFAAGSRVKVVLNQDDGKLYRFDQSGSPGIWAELAVSGAVQVENLDSPVTSVAAATIKIANNLELTDEGGGVVRIDATGGGGGGNETPDSHPASPDDADDEFEYGTNIDTTGARRAGATPWAWRNQGGATDTIDKGALIILAPDSAGIAMRMIEQDAPAGAYRYRCKLTHWLPAINYTRAGLFVLRTASSKLLAVDTAYSTGFQHQANSWNINGPYIGAIGSTTPFIGDAYDKVYLEIEYDGSSIYTFRFSKTGHEGTWTTIGTEAQATNLGGAADKIGLYVNIENSAGAGSGIFDWFRRMA